MDTMKEPGIAIEHIRLLSSQVRMLNAEAEHEYNLQLTALNRLESPDGQKLDFHTAFDLMHGIEKPLFEFKCEFFARYTRQGESDSISWNEFTSAMALAHIIPYVREFVSNVTNRLPTPVLMLNPINTYAMIANYEEQIQQTEKENPASTPREEL